MTLEQYLLETPPPRKLWGTLLTETPAGRRLQWLALLELICLGVAPLPFVLPAASLKELPYLQEPFAWLATWLLMCAGVTLYSRWLRGRFWLVEQGEAVQGRLADVTASKYLRSVGSLPVQKERFTFSVVLPGGECRDFVSEDHTPGWMRATVTAGDPITALTHGETCRLLGLEGVDPQSALLRPVYSLPLRLAYYGGSLGLLGLLFYTWEFCEVLDDIPVPEWAMLGGALAGIGLALMCRRRIGWSVARAVVMGYGLSSGVVLIFPWLANCWLDYTPPQWRPAQIQEKSVQRVPLLPFELCYLKLKLDGKSVELACLPGRGAALGPTVQVRAHQGALGYRWIGDVR